MSGFVAMGIYTLSDAQTISLLRRILFAITPIGVAQPSPGLLGKAGLPWVAMETNERTLKGFRSDWASIVTALHNPYRVELRVFSRPRVVRKSGQPWAALRNAFSVEDFKTRCD
jgi:hypothetical protein